MTEILKSRITILRISVFVVGSLAPVYSRSANVPEVPIFEGAEAVIGVTAKKGGGKAAASKPTAVKKSKSDKSSGVKFIATPPKTSDAPESNAKPEKPAGAIEPQPAVSGGKKPDAADAKMEPPPLPPLPEAVPGNVLPGNSTNQLYEPAPAPSHEGGVANVPNVPPPKPPEQLIYSIGKIVIKYETDVRKRNPKLPAEDKLMALSVTLAESGGIFYHIPQIKSADKRKSGGDPAIPQVTPPTTTIPEKAAPVKGAVSSIVPAAPNAGPTVKEPAKTKGKAAEKIPVPTAQAVKFQFADGAKPRSVSAGALSDIYDAIVEQINANGLIGVYISSNLDPRAGERAWKNGADVEIVISVSEVQAIRTISRRIPFRVGDISLINDDEAADGQAVKDKKHLWIKEKSPIKAGEVIQKELLQDYLTRLNRFVGRRVDAAMNASGQAGKVILDYLIKEQKQFSIYAQTSNTGTDATGLFRHRLGAEYKQLRNMDDILRFEYVTSDPSRFQSAFASYELAIMKPDRLKARIYTSYGQYSADDIGLGLQTFEGENTTLGATLTWTPKYWHGFPLDISMGVEWFIVKTDNQGVGQAEGAFILPSIGFGTDRKTDKFSLSIDLTVQASLGGPSQKDLDGLGRIETEANFILAKWDVSASTYLEPIIYGSKWRDYARRELPMEKDKAEFEAAGGQERFGVNLDTFFATKQKAEQNWKRGIRAHEFAVNTRGQYTVGDHRLPPQLMSIAGGFNTVRGYPEAFSSGDNSWMATLEYRLHIPRLFAPYEVVDARKDMKMLLARTKPEPVPVVKGKKGSPAPTVPPSPPSTPPVQLLSAQDKKRAFNYRAPQAGGDPDWDLIFRVFSDGAQTFNNRLQPATEVDRTMFSIGAGFEVQLNKRDKPDKAGFNTYNSLPNYATIRLDYGLALSDESDLLLKPVNAGDSRLHLSGTVAW